MEDEPDMYAAKYLKAAMVRLPSNAAMTARVPASLWAMAIHSRPASPSGQPCTRDPPIPCLSPDPPRPPSMAPKRELSTQIQPEALVERPVYRITALGPVSAGDRSCLRVRFDSLDTYGDNPRPFHRRYGQPIRRHVDTLSGLGEGPETLQDQ